MNMTVKQAANLWYSHMAPGWSDSSQRNKRHQIDKVIVPAIGDRPIADVDAHQLNVFVQGLVRRNGEPLKPSSRRQTKAALSGLWEYALENEWVARNHARSIKIANPYTEPRPAPDADSIRRTLHTETDVRWRTLLMLAATTGMRRGELAALRWEDIDGKHLKVRRAVSQAGVVGRPKTRRGLRTITLGPSVVAQLRKLREARPEMLESSYIFSEDPQGLEPLRPDTITQWWTRNRRNDDMRFHDLRHNAATQMLAAGFDVVTVAQRLGDTPEIILNTYAHLLPAKDEQAAALMESAIRPLRNGAPSQSRDSQQPPSTEADRSPGTPAAHPSSQTSAA